MFSKPLIFSKSLFKLTYEVKFEGANAFVSGRLILYIQ